MEKRIYDADGNLTLDAKQAPGGAWQKTVNIYNADEELAATRQYTDAAAYLETDYGYDANGNRATVRDPLGHAVTTSYAINNLKEYSTVPYSSPNRHSRSFLGNMMRHK